jgi:hypothetical protein
MNASGGGGGGGGVKTFKFSFLDDFLVFKLCFASRSEHFFGGGARLNEPNLRPLKCKIVFNTKRECGALRVESRHSRKDFFRVESVRKRELKLESEISRDFMIFNKKNKSFVNSKST